MKAEKNLVLITNHFPFGVGEAFLESEIDYLTASFQRVIVVARDVKSKETRQTKGTISVYRVNPESTFGEKLLTVFLYAVKIRKVVRCLREEIAFIKEQGLRFSRPIIRQMLHDLTKAVTTAYHIEKIVQSERVTGETILYSYWMNNSALANALVHIPSVVIRRVVRIHGGDVYDYRSPLKYLSFRKTIVSNTDAVYAVSENGRSYLQEKLSHAFDEKIRLSRLGTHGRSLPDECSSTAFRVLSCSFMVGVKRLHLLIEALTFVNVKLEWVHIGDGPLKKEIEQLAQEKLSAKNNITYSFIGTVSNNDLMQYYQQNDIHLFVNTSASEGIPVTMMEAQSFGVPIVAAAVGGIPEIVSDENGRLLPAEADAADFAEKITEVLTLPSETYQRLRAHARTTWENQYNADRNFSNFVAQIKAL